MADGKVSIPYSHFLGYEKGENGLPKIVEKEAETVRLIYRMFLEGKTPSAIARDQRRNRQNKSLILDRFIREIETRTLLVDEFDENLWLVAIDKVIVHTTINIRFTFRGGTVITA